MQVRSRGYQTALIGWSPTSPALIAWSPTSMGCTWLVGEPGSWNPPAYLFGTELHLAIGDSLAAGPPLPPARYRG